MSSISSPQTPGSPTAALLAAVEALAAVIPADLCVAELQQVVGVLAPAMGRLAGVQSALVGELDVRSGGSVPSAPGPDGSPGPEVLVRHWLRDLTNSGGSAAGRQVRESVLLRSLPQVAQAVRDGIVGPAQAAVLTRLVGKIDPDALAEAEPALIEVAMLRDPQSLATYIAHLLATWCEPQFEADLRAQEAKRFLQTRREDDGMLSGRFRLTREDSEVFQSLLEPLARKTGLSDDRSAGQRRADALVDVFGIALRYADDLPDAGGFRPQVSYVIPAGWAAGDSPIGTFADLIGASLPTDTLFGTVGGFDPAAPPVEDRCAIGAWSGPQTRARIEMILCDARLTRLLLDSVGQVKGLEALGDTITTTQRQALLGRDHGCAARGCTRPPAFCDAHHLDHRADGGATSITNLVSLCRYHHLRWHQGRIGLRDLHIPWFTGEKASHDPPF